MDPILNTSQTSTEEIQSMPAPFSSQTMFIYELCMYLLTTGAFAVLGVVSNILNLIVFYRQGILSNSSTVYLTGLAVSDGLSCVTSLVRIVGIYLEKFLESAAKPSTANSIAILFANYVGTTIQITCWITAFTAFERAISVLYPFSFKAIFTPKRSLAVVFAIFIGAIMGDLPNLLNRSVAWTVNPATNESYMEAYRSNHVSQELRRLWVLFSPVCARFTAIAVVMFCNIILFWKVNSSHKFRNRSRIAENRTKNDSAEVSSIVKEAEVTKKIKLHLQESLKVTTFKLVNSKYLEKNHLDNIDKRQLDNSDSNLTTLSTDSSATQAENIDIDLNRGKQKPVSLRLDITESSNSPKTMKDVRTNSLHEEAATSNSDKIDSSVRAKTSNIRGIEENLLKCKTVPSNSDLLDPQAKQDAVYAENTKGNLDRDQEVLMSSLNVTSLARQHNSIQTEDIMQNYLARDEIIADSDTLTSAFKQETISNIVELKKQVKFSPGIPEQIDTANVEAINIISKRESNSNNEFAQDNGKLSKSDKNKPKILKIKELKLLRMIIAMSLLFLACYIPCVPYSVIFFYVLERGKDYHFYDMYVCWILVVLIQTINSSTNIFIYYKMSSRYKEEFDKLFCLPWNGSPKKGKQNGCS